MLSGSQKDHGTIAKALYGIYWQRLLSFFGVLEVELTSAEWMSHLKYIEALSLQCEMTQLKSQVNSFGGKKSYTWVFFLATSLSTYCPAKSLDGIITQWADNSDTSIVLATSSAKMAP